MEVGCCHKEPLARLCDRSQVASMDATMIVNGGACRCAEKHSSWHA